MKWWESKNWNTIKSISPADTQHNVGLKAVKRNKNIDQINIGIDNKLYLEISLEYDTATHLNTDCHEPLGEKGLSLDQIGFTFNWHSNHNNIIYNNHSQMWNEGNQSDDNKRNFIVFEQFFLRVWSLLIFNVRQICIAHCAPLHLQQQQQYEYICR